MVTIKKAGTDAIPVIKNLANIIWPATYSEIISPRQVDYMMELIYSAAAIKKQMETGHQFVLAYNDDKPVAFASYSLHENKGDVYKLHKIYILPNQQGKGIGKQMIAFIKADIAPANTLQLNVNRHNKALQFYQRLGFSIINDEDISIGAGFFMNDYVMELRW